MVSGRWRIKRDRAVATLSITPFRQFTTTDQDAVGDEGLRLLTFSEPEAQAHDIEFRSLADD